MLAIIFAPFLWWLAASKVVMIGIAWCSPPLFSAAFFLLGRRLFPRLCNKVLFKIIVDISMNQHSKSQIPRKETRHLVTALAFIGIAVLIGVLAISWMPRGSGLAALQSITDPKIDPNGHAKQLGRAEIDTRFQQGVMMLHAKQYEFALAAFERVLKLSPNMPEAYVNKGYALLGIERYADAAEAFDKATILRPNQANAYWGLAIALERSGNLRGARDPMMTFIHLTKSGDPYQSKAQAILAEWEKKIDAQELQQSKELSDAQKNGGKALAK